MRTLGYLNRSDKSHFFFNAIGWLVQALELLETEPMTAYDIEHQGRVVRGFWEYSGGLAFGSSLGAFGV
jgi:hypothetical protein